MKKCYNLGPGDCARAMCTGPRSAVATDASLSADPGVASSIPALPMLSWRSIMK